MSNGSFLSAAIVILVTLVSQRAHATDIYHWVDDEGVAHFSDTRPNDDSGVRTLQVNHSNPTGYDPDEDPYSIANQAKRINDKWSALADQREQRQKARRERVQTVVQHRPSRYAGWRYYDWPGPYQPPYSAKPPWRQLPAIRRQTNLLETLGLSGPRPYSINSSAHHARVKRSNNFLSTRTTPR